MGFNIPQDILDQLTFDAVRPPKKRKHPRVSGIKAARGRVSGIKAARPNPRVSTIKSSANQDTPFIQPGDISEELLNFRNDPSRSQSVSANVSPEFIFQRPRGTELENFNVAKRAQSTRPNVRITGTPFDPNIQPTDLEQLDPVASFAQGQTPQDVIDADFAAQSPFVQERSVAGTLAKQDAQDELDLQAFDASVFSGVPDEEINLSFLEQIGSAFDPDNADRTITTLGRIGAGLNPEGPFAGGGLAAADISAGNIIARESNPETATGDLRGLSPQEVKQVTDAQLAQVSEEARQAEKVIDQELKAINAQLQLDTSLTLEDRIKLNDLKADRLDERARVGNEAKAEVQKAKDVARITKEENKAAEVETKDIRTRLDKVAVAVRKAAENFLLGGLSADAVITASRELDITSDMSVDQIVTEAKEKARSDKFNKAVGPLPRTGKSSLPPFLGEDDVNTIDLDNNDGDLISQEFLDTTFGPGTPETTTKRFKRTQRP